MLVASEEEKQELEQAMESVKKMGYARDARILALENEGQLKQIQSTMHDLLNHCYMLMCCCRLGVTEKISTKSSHNGAFVESQGLPYHTARKEVSSKGEGQE